MCLYDCFQTQFVRIIIILNVVITQVKVASAALDALRAVVRALGDAAPATARKVAFAVVGRLREHRRVSSFLDFVQIATHTHTLERYSRE